LAWRGVGHERPFVRQEGLRFKKNDTTPCLPVTNAPVRIAAVRRKLMSEKDSNIAAEKLQSGKSHAAEAASELRAAAEAKFQDVRDKFSEHASHYREKASQVWADTAGRARTLSEDGEDYIRENPLQAVGIALAVGFVLGVILRR